MKKIRTSIRRVSLTIFLVAMLLCASLVLASFWVDGMERRFFDRIPIAPSLFIVGLASFLIWVVIIVQDIYEMYTKNKK